MRQGTTAPCAAVFLALLAATLPIKYAIASYPASNVSVTFSNHPNGTVAPGLFGISGSNIDMKTFFGNDTGVVGPGKTAPGQEWIFTLLENWWPCKNCKGPTLRINGNSNYMYWGDWWWNHTSHPGMNYPSFFGGGTPSNGWGNVSTADMTVVLNAVRKFNSTLTLGLDWHSLQYKFKNTCQNTSLQTQMVTLVNNLGGKDIVRYEIGNEYDYGDGGRVDCFTNSSGLIQEWMLFAKSLVATGAPPSHITGFVLAQGTGWYGYIPSFEEQARHSIGVPVDTCGHFYAGDKGQETMDTFLSDKLAHDYVYPQRAAGAAMTRAAGGQWLTQEASSINNGGQPGLSDVFASALWAADAYFYEAQIGSQAININLGAGCATDYDPFCVADISGPTDTGPLQVNPFFYGITLLVRAFAANDNVPAVILQGQRAENTSDPQIKVFAVRRNGNTWDGINGEAVAIVAVNKNQVGNVGVVNVTLNGFTTTASTATLERLESKDGLTAKTGITLAGQTWDGSKDGKPMGERTKESVPISKTTPSSPMLSFTVPPAQAAIVFLPVQV